MKKRILQLTSILIVTLISAPAFAEVITKEGFGETTWIANPASANVEGHPVPGSSYNPRSGDGYYHLTQMVQDSLDCENGTWVAGSDSSIRTETYVVGAANNTKPWSDTSSINHLVLTAPTRYHGAWDTISLTNINIKYYEFMELKFGWGKRWNTWVTHHEDIRGLKIEYRIDGGSWKMLDTTKLDNPLAGDVWSLADELYIDETGDVLDIMFTAYNHDNQIGIDDIVLTGDYNPLGISNITNNTFNVYPNPVAGELNISLRNFVNGQYEIHTVDGLKLSSGLLLNKQERIDVSQLSAGIYLISVNLDGNVGTVKFIK